MAVVTAVALALAFIPAAPAMLRSSGARGKPVELRQARARAVSYTGRVGVHTHLFRFGTSEDALYAQLTRIHDGGVDWIREDFLWHEIEPTRGRFDWAKYDALMAAAARARVRVTAIIAYSARWASSNPSSPNWADYPPRAAADYAAFAAAVANRYGTNGVFWRTRPDLVPLPVAAFDIWNEPWLPMFWKSGPDPAQYDRLVRAASAAVRAEDPAIRILASGDLLDGRGAPWLERLLDLDPSLPQIVDAFSVHPYCGAASPYARPAAPAQPFGRVAEIHALLASRGATTPIWITEIGWSTQSSAHPGVTERQQSVFVHDAVVRAIGDWGSYVQRVFIYGWMRSSGTPADDYGLLRSDGTPKAAWESLTQLLRS